MDGHGSVRVEFFYDDESQHWGFTSADPAIIGGGDRTLEAAARHFARVLADTVRWEHEEAADVGAQQRQPAGVA
ncbi:MAG TPA: hypothetical protein VIU62_22270 [Chloroflexota bacterium]